VAAVRRRGASGLIAVVAPRSALAALEPLCGAYAERGPVATFERDLLSVAELRELAAGAEAVLVVGPRRRSPRTALPGPFVRTADGRRAPIGWVPDCGREALRRFATTAARVHARAGAGRTVAVLAQRSRRYRDLSGRIERLLGESGGGARPLRWTADELTRADLSTGLAVGLAAAVYVGHGRPVGWVGYGGTRSHHLAGAAEPTAAVLSLTCLTASRRRVGLSFAEALVLQGVAAATFGAVCSTDFHWNARWALRLTGALANGCATIGDLVASADDDDPAVAGYRILGDPVAPLADAPGAALRAERLTQSVSL